MRELELLVLGTGPAAATVASQCRRAGMTVAIVDPLPFGGTCALRGCNPKKVLVRAAELFDWLDRSKGTGLRAEGVAINWDELITFKRSFTEPVPASREERFYAAGIEQFHGTPRFLSPARVTIDGDEFECDKIVVATGAVPRKLNIPGEEHLTTSDDFLDLLELPRCILFIGAGYITFEFAHVAVRAGAEVTVCERAQRPLPQFEPDLVDCLVDRSRELGIDLQTSTEVTSIEKRASGSLIVGLTRDGISTSVEADLVVHGAGRVPNVEGLDLEAASVRHGPRGIEVTRHFQSITNPAVYAAGDVADTGAPMLSPVAIEQGRILAYNLTHDDPKTPDLGPVPTAVFSSPALAAVGLTEHEAREQGLELDIRAGNRSSNNSMKKVGAKHARYKVLIEEPTGRLLGAHLLGPDAAETINLFALAIRFGLTAKELKSTLLVFPTFANDVRSMV